MPSQLECPYQMMHGGMSGAPVLPDKYLEILTLYKNKHEYIIDYDSNA